MLKCSLGLVSVLSLLDFSFENADYQQDSDNR